MSLEAQSIVIMGGSGIGMAIAKQAVCPVIDDGDIRGIGIFNASLHETRRIMDEDPGVQGGIFVYETHCVEASLEIP